MKVFENISKEEHMIGIIFLIALFLPHSSTALLLVNPILCVYLAFHFSATKKYRGLGIKNVFIMSLIVTIIFNSILGEASSKSVIAASTLVLMLWLFPFIGDVKIRNVYIYFSIIYILVSQLAMFLHLPGVSSFYETVYPISEDNMENYQRILYYADSSNISGFRFSGLFRNPNQCAKYLTLITVVYLLDSNPTIRKSIPLLGIIAMSILMTGSRTGLVVFLCIVFFSYTMNDTLSKKARNRSFFLLIAMTIILLYNASDFRGLKIDEGFSDSGSAKFNAVLDYLSHNTNPFMFLFGHLDQFLFAASSDDIHATFDCEYGYMIFNYGMVGFLLYIIFFTKLYKSFTKQERLIFVPMLWILSASMLLAYRSLFLFMFLLSKYYVSSINNNICNKITK